MNKKVVWITVILILIILILFYFFWPEKEIVEEGVRYSNYAPDWVEEIEEITPNNKTIEIDVVEATEGRGEFMARQVL